MSDRQSSEAVVIERTFDAPVGVVWAMWTDPTHFAAWYGPEGASVEVVRMDVRVGGGRLVAMHIQTPDGSRSMWFTGEYREVVENERLAYTESMADAQGRTVTPAEVGMPQSRPAVTEVRLELEETGGRTRMLMTHAGVPADSPGAVGWNMAFDKLASYITEVKSG